MVGKAVDAVEAKKLDDELIGRSPAAADAKFGQPNDVFAQVGGPRKWRVYPGGMMDVMGNQRYVLEVNRNSIAGVATVKLDASGIDLARKYMFDQKVSGKTPKECEAALDLGPPRLTARSEISGNMAQIFDARMGKEIGSPKYCRLKFDASGRYIEIALIDVEASAGDKPPA
ncbi:MAG: hypothetical protein HZA51_04840 [Planctomycetes bacterium]|nr:hypothetical protein [Planctomycetota bacterium]